VAAVIPKCEQRKADCNNFTIHGRCMALTDTHFSKPCPFYCSVRDTSPYNLKFHVIEFKTKFDMRED